MITTTPAECFFFLSFFFFFSLPAIRCQNDSIDAPQKPRESGLIIFYGLFISISWSVYFTIQHSPYAFAQEPKLKGKQSGGKNEKKKKEKN